MKNLKEIIQEKLVINKNLKSQIQEINQEDLPKYSRDLEQKISSYLWFKGNNLYSHMEKMESYMNKGSKPERLIKSIKDDKKLFNRWFAAIKLNWVEAYKEFGKALEDRGVFTLPELHSFILNRYKSGNYQGYSNNFKEYLNIYKIKLY